MDARNEWVILLQLNNQSTLDIATFSIDKCHVYLVPDTLIGVNSNGTQGGEDAGSDLCYAVVVMCGGEAQHARRAWSWEGIFSGSWEGRD